MKHVTVDGVKTQSFEIPIGWAECGMVMGVRFGLLMTGLSAAGFVLGKEISRKGWTSLHELVMLDDGKHPSTRRHA